MSKRVWFGLLAALGAGGIGADAWGTAHNWPLMHKILDGDWAVGQGILYVTSSMMAAVFGYLALNYQEPPRTPPHGPTGTLN